MPEEISIAKLWLAKAMNDLLNVENNLKAEQIPYDAVCFRCQQAAEKLLKGFLVGTGHPYPITHDLFLILEKIIPLNDQAESLRDHLAIPAPYAVEIRYPDDWHMPSGEDTVEARNAANEVLNWLKKTLPEIFQEREI